MVINELAEWLSNGAKFRVVTPITNNREDIFEAGEIVHLDHISDVIANLGHSIQLRSQNQSTKVLRVSVSFLNYGWFEVIANDTSTSTEQAI